MEKDKVRSVINAYFKFGHVNREFTGEVNEEVARIFGEMLDKTYVCDSAFSWVPHPAGGKATISWIARNFTRTMVEQLESKSYRTCGTIIINTYITSLESAGRGL